MKIGDLFIALGIKIDGAEQLEAVNKSLGEAALRAGELVTSLGGSAGAFTNLGKQVEGLKKQLDDLSKTSANPALAATAQKAPQASGGVDKVAASSSNAKASLAKMAAVVATVNAGLALLVNNALQSAVALKNFTTQTGLSADELQRWKHAAAMNDVTGQELTETIKGIQTAAAQMALTGEGIGPWAMLGIDPHQDPFVVLGKLREEFKKMDPGMARNIAAQMGISDNLFQMLLSDLDKLNGKYLLNKEETGNLIALNRAWKDLMFTIGAMKDKVASTLAVPLKHLALILQGVVSVISTLYHLLNDTIIVGSIFRGVMYLLGAVLVAFVAVASLGVAVLTSMAGWAIIASAAATGFSVAMGVLGSAIGLCSVAFGALWAVLAPILPILLAISAAIAAVVLIGQDLYAFFTGGKSLIGDAIESHITLFKALGAAVVHVWDGIVATVSSAIGAIKALIPDWLLNLFGGGSEIKADLPQANLASMEQSALAPSTSRTSNDVSQVNNVNVNVDGSGSPEDTGREVGRGVRQAITDAAYQIPVPSY